MCPPEIPAGTPCHLWAANLPAGIDTLGCAEPVEAVEREHALFFQAVHGHGNHASQIRKTKCSNHRYHMNFSFAMHPAFHGCFLFLCIFSIHAFPQKSTTIYKFENCNLCILHKLMKCRKFFLHFILHFENADAPVQICRIAVLCAETSGNLHYPRRAPAPECSFLHRKLAGSALQSRKNGGAAAFCSCAAGMRIKIL